MNTLRLIAASMLITASLVGGGRASAAVVLLDTFGPGNAVGGSGFATSSTLRIAIPFVVPPGPAVTFSSITVGLIDGAPASRIVLVGSVGGVPYPMTLETFSVPARPFGSTESAIETIEAPQRLLLQPGGQFWFVWEGPFSSATSPLNGQLARVQTSNGTWAGLGAPDPAMRATAEAAGACCNTTTGSCTLAAPSVCVGLALAYRGDGVACSPVNCTAAIARGACCIANPEPRCLVRSAAECSQASGQYFGANTTCPPPGSPNLCCPADFNGSESVSVQDIFSFLAAYLAGCP